MDEKNDRELFASRLKILIKEKGVTLQEVSDYTGIPKSTIWEYTAGNSVVPLSNAKKIATYFGEDLHWLAGMTDERSKKQA